MHIYIHTHTQRAHVPLPLLPFRTLYSRDDARVPRVPLLLREAIDEGLASGVATVDGGNSQVPLGVSLPCAAACAASQMHVSAG